MANVNDSNGSGVSDDESFPERLRLKKKDKKEKGYASLEKQSSEEELVESSRSNSKVKKAKVFKLHTNKAKEKEHKHSSSNQSLKKKKDKENKKDDKSSKSPRITPVPLKPIFGVPLEVALCRSKSHDGVPVPAIFRQCIDFVTENGLETEGIYRISPGMSQIDEVVRHVNTCALNMQDYVHFDDSYVAAAILKKFLRELPENLLTADWVNIFERSARGSDAVAKIESLTRQLPLPNRYTLCYLFMHMQRVIENSTSNKMALSNIGLVLLPTLNFSQSLLNIYLQHSDTIFADMLLKKYIPPMKPQRGGTNVVLPSTLRGIEEEMAKQESLLSSLHEDMSQGDTMNDEKGSQLWDVQYMVTQLKRKKKEARRLEAEQLQSQAKSQRESQAPCIDNFEEKQLLAVRTMLIEQIKQEEKNIELLRLKLKQKQELATEKSVQTDTSSEKSEDDLGHDYDAEAEELLIRQKELIGLICEEQCKCAHLQAKVEMLTALKEENQISTSNSARTNEITRL